MLSRLLRTELRLRYRRDSKVVGFLLPFLGEVQRLRATQTDGHPTFKLPAISKGAVFWYEPSPEKLAHFLPNSGGRLGKPDCAAALTACVASPSGHLTGANYHTAEGRRAQID